MSIARLKRVTVYGLTAEKADVLDGLQDLGCLHLVGLRPTARGAEDAAAAGPKAMNEALRHLERSPRQRPPATEDVSTDTATVVEHALRNRQGLRDVRDRIDELEHAIRDVEPWGDFVLPPREALGGVRLWFYVVPHHHMKTVRASDLTWEMARRDHRHAYVVVMSDDEPSEEIPGHRAEIGERSLSVLRCELEQALQEEQELITERQVFTQWIDRLRRDLTRAENHAALELASVRTLDNENVFAMQGWVPADRANAVVTFTATRGLACTTEDPSPTDTPPVLLQNPDPVDAGEDLVSFFQLPGYRDWDPSAVIFISFALFFAMILSDAGYAAVLGLVLIGLWKRIGRTPAGRRLRRLFTAVVVTSMAWGALLGSYFGISPGSGSTLSTLKLLDINDFNAMMMLSAIVGAIHVIVANVMVAWNRRRSWAALASAGWIAIIIGGLLAVAGQSTPGLVEPGVWTLSAGGLAILLFSSERPLSGPTDMLWRLLDGLKAATGLSTAVGDVLSYLRLFALGLSSASLAITFNGLATQAMDAIPGVGLLFGLMILVVGHTLNLLLASISGIVHGMRLNLIEFYRWGIHEEGTPFRAFRKKERLTWTQ